MPNLIYLKDHSAQYVAILLFILFYLFIFCSLGQISGSLPMKTKELEQLCIWKKQFFF